MNKVKVIIPAFNEQDSIGQVIEDIPKSISSSKIGAITSGS